MSIISVHTFSKNSRFEILPFPQILFVQMSLGVPCDPILHDDCAFVQDLCVPDGHALNEDGLVCTHDSLVDVSFSCTDLDDDFDSGSRLLSGTG